MNCLGHVPELLVGLVPLVDAVENGQDERDHYEADRQGQDTLEQTAGPRISAARSSIAVVTSSRRPGHQNPGRNTHDA